MSLKVLGIVPVKSKSTGIEKKNFERICGKTLVEWTLLQATQSKLDAILVVTDSCELLEMCKSHNIACSIVDTTGSVNDSIIESAKTGLLASYDYLMLLQVTSPCRTASNINDAIDMLPAEYVVSVFQSHAANFCFRGQDPIIEWPNSEPNRQELESFLQLNGAIFLIETKQYLFCKTFDTSKNNKKFYVMPASRSIDIDEQWQLDVCRHLIELSASDYVLEWPSFEQKVPTPALQPVNCALE